MAKTIGERRSARGREVEAFGAVAASDVRSGGDGGEAHLQREGFPAAEFLRGRAGVCDLRKVI